MKHGFVSQRMKFCIGYKDKLGKVVVIACAVSVELAKSIATAMANDLNLVEYYSPRQRPIIYVYDDEGRQYGAF